MRTAGKIAFLLVSIAQFSYSSTVLDFEVTESSVGLPPGREQKKSLRTSVFLSPQKIRKETPETIQVWDYSKMRILTADLSNKSLRDDSLLAPLALRVYEAQNRKMISEVLGQAGLSSGAGPAADDPVFTEHSLSVPAPGAPSTDVKEENSPEGAKFTHGGKCLFERSSAGKSVSAEDSRLFALFLRNSYGIHPKILSSLAAGGLIPEKISIGLYDGPITRQINLKLVSSEELEFPADPAFRPSAAQGGLEVALTNAAEISEDEVEAAGGAKVKAAQEAETEGRYLDAFALLLSAALHADNRSAMEELEKMRDTLLQEDSVQLLAESISPNSEEAARKASSDLEKLHGMVSEQAQPVIAIFRANVLVSLGDMKEAEKSFLAALEADPTLAGGWKDLGDVYLVAYDTPKAWRCYDTAKRLSPSHPFVREIEAHEKDLMSSHPDFFP
jgi:hypothetical protein